MLLLVLGGRLVCHDLHTDMQKAENDLQSAANRHVLGITMASSSATLSTARSNIPVKCICTDS